MAIRSLAKLSEPFPQEPAASNQRFAGSLIGGITAALLGAALMSAAVKAEDLPFGPPTAAYSGVTVTEVGGQTVRSRVYYTPGHQRMEMEMGGAQQVMLIDFDNEISYMIMPQTKSYMALPQSGHGAAAGLPGAGPADGSGAQVEHEVVGEETLDGHMTTKYRFTVTGPKTTTTGFIWVTREGIVLRSESETTGSDAAQMPGRVTITLEDLEIAPQDAALFELPAGYQKIGVN